MRGGFDKRTRPGAPRFSSDRFIWCVLVRQSYHTLSISREINRKCARGVVPPIPLLRQHVFGDIERPIEHCQSVPRYRPAVLSREFTKDEQDIHKQIHSARRRASLKMGLMIDTCSRSRHSPNSRQFGRCSHNTIHRPIRGKPELPDPT